MTAQGIPGPMISALRRLSFLVLIGLSGCAGKPDGVEPIRPFDINRYAGKWFEIMRLDHRFERGLSNVTATYTLETDGSVEVVNRGFDRKECKWKEAKGRAVLQAAPEVASLSVTFFWPFAGGYHVFALDKANYEWAAISGPSRNYLWIPARRPNLAPARKDHIVEKARKLGFPVDDLILVDHTTPNCRASH